MERRLMSELVEWKTKKHRKPLILWGARQVGKTWLMREFGDRYFDNTVYISFYNNKKISSIFDKDFDVKRILKAIEIELHTDIRAEKTLIIFDEVQSTPKVVESLKYFCEDASEYAVVSAGSLLGVALHEGISFPVGKVDEMHLYPMSFREFLVAVGESELAGYCGDHKLLELNDHIDRYKELLREYYCVGGMPEVVLRYTENKDLRIVREVQLSILHQYEGDFGKHVGPNELERIRMLWNSLPMQLAKENKKFFFGLVKHGARYKDYEIALQWLVDSGLVIKVNKVTKPVMPLKAYLDHSSFKVFLLDVGLLGALSELDADSILYGNDIFTEFKGALAEQYVAQQLVADTVYTPYYYSGEKSTYELDFLVQKGSAIMPVEVKAEDNLRSKSLRFFCEKYKPKYAVRLSAAPYREQDWMINVPLWAVASI